MHESTLCRESLLLSNREMTIEKIINIKLHEEAENGYNLIHDISRWSSFITFAYFKATFNKISIYPKSN